MRKLSFLFLFILPFGLFAQNAIQVKVSGMIFNAKIDSVFISQNFGSYYKNYAATALDKKGNFQFNVQLPNPDYYYLRVGSENIHLILKNNSDIKVYGDGALGSRGACLLQPYADKAGWSGFLLSSPAHFDSIAAKLINTDFQMCTHAIGDSANRTILKVYAKYLKGKNDKRWRIEHAQIIDPNDFHYFGDNSIIPSVQPTHGTSDMYWAGERLGAARLKGGYAYKQLLEQNNWLPLGTDFPVEEINPFKTFLAAAVRKDAKGFPTDGFQMENVLTREQTIRGMTIWAAKANRMEHQVGSLEVGKKADLVIIRATDLNMVPIHDPVSTVVMQTSVHNIDTVIINGQVKKKDGKILFENLDAYKSQLEKSGKGLMEKLRKSMH